MPLTIDQHTTKKDFSNVLLFLKNAKRTGIFVSEIHDESLQHIKIPNYQLHKILRWESGSVTTFYATYPVDYICESTTDPKEITHYKTSVLNITSQTISQLQNKKILTEISSTSQKLLANSSEQTILKELTFTFSKIGEFEINNDLICLLSAINQNIN